MCMKICVFLLYLGVEKIYFLIMKFLIVSDIHGDSSSAHRIKELFESFKPDKILLLGDILYHGPRNDLPSEYAPKEVIKVMNSLSDHIVAVRGNCEAEVDQMVLTFPCMSTTAEVFADGHEFTLSHGHIYNESVLPPGNGVFLYGHTHIPVAHEVEGRICFNPGSCTLPKGGFPRSYGTYEEGVLTVRELFTSEILMSVSL